MAYYDFIRIYGLPSSDAEVFQGLGAAANYNGAEGQPVSGGGGVPALPAAGDAAAGAIPPALWAAQTVTIQRQSDFLRTLSGTYAEKLAALPAQPGWWAVVGDSVLEWFTGNLTDWLLDGFVGDVVDAGADVLMKINIIKQIADFLIEFSFNAWDYVKLYYNEVSKICMDMVSENDALCQLEPSYQHYDVRNATQQQHDATMKNIVALIDALEKDMKNALPNDEMKQLVSGIEALQFNDQEIDFGGVRVALRSKLITEP